MANPLTDVKAELAAIFADLKGRLYPFDPERQRFHNRTWNIPSCELP